jgi:hypothetical protein
LHLGPQRGKGLVALCNRELNAVQFIAQITQEFLKHFEFQGIDFQKFSKHFSTQNLKQEEVVNRGYKELIFSAFQSQRPEAIPRRGPFDSLCPYNKIIGAELIKCSNEKFALAENLISPHEPVFEADLFGAQGKVMDSWESARHNPKEFEYLILKLKEATNIQYINISTKYHLGNQVPAISLSASTADEPQNWTEILPKTLLDGHALKRIKVEAQNKEKFSYLKICTYPDGGLTRLSLFDESLPASEVHKYKVYSEATSEIFKESIPKTKKPLSFTCFALFSRPYPPLCWGFAFLNIFWRLFRLYSFYLATP